MRSDGEGMKLTVWSLESTISESCALSVFAPYFQAHPSILG